MSRRQHSIRKIKGKGEQSYYVISLPKPLAERVPAETRFVAELVEEGILLRRVETVPPPPSWASGRDHA